jgi:hypothetical protein
MLNPTLVQKLETVNRMKTGFLSTEKSIIVFRVLVLMPQQASPVSSLSVDTSSSVRASLIGVGGSVVIKGTALPKSWFDPGTKSFGVDLQFLNRCLVTSKSNTKVKHFSKGYFI